MARFHSTGHVFSDRFSGPTYRVKSGQEVCLTADGRLFDTEGRGSIIIDNRLKTEVEAMVKADEAEQAYRDRLSATLAGGDSVLRELFDRHLWFTDGEMEEAIERDGHTLWVVGRNAGGTFYAGVTNGERVVWYDAPSGWDEDAEEELPPSPPRVGDDWGYLGHC